MLLATCGDGQSPGSAAAPVLPPVLQAVGTDERVGIYLLTKGDGTIRKVSTAALPADPAIPAK